MKARVCSNGDVQNDDMVMFNVDGTPVLLARVGGKYYALHDMCSHAEASLSEGHLDTDELTVECPLHNAVFSLRDGEALEFPGEDAVPSYAVMVEGSDIYVELPDA